MIGIGSSIPLLKSIKGTLVSDQSNKAAILSEIFDGNELGEVVKCPSQELAVSLA